MTTAGFEQFFERVLRDEALQTALRDIEDADEFIARVVELGAEHNYRFTAGDVNEALRISRRTWLERST